MLRVQLQNNTIGQVTLERADPIDINSVIQNIKRSKENEGVIYEIILDLSFIKDGRAFVKKAFEKAGGLDALVVVNFYGLNPNTRRWILEFTGKINFNKYEVHEDQVVVTIEQTGFQTSVLNLLNTDVDLGSQFSKDGSHIVGTYENGYNVLYPAALPVSIPFHSKTILKQYKATPVDQNEYSQPLVLHYGFPACVTIGGCDRSVDLLAYGQIDNSKASLSELTQSFVTPYGYSTAGVLPVYVADEAGSLDIHLLLNLKHGVAVNTSPAGMGFCGTSNLYPAKEVKAWFRHTDKNDAVYPGGEVSFGTWAHPFDCGDDISGDFQAMAYDSLAVNVAIGDKFYVYFTFRLHGTLHQPFGDPGGAWDWGLNVTSGATTSMQFVQRTTAPASNVNTVLIYEAVQKCVQFYTNQQDCFRSSLIGRTDIVLPDGTHPYSIDGEYALLGITNGTNLRQGSQRLFASLQALLNFLDSVACIGFGFEWVNGRQMLVLEKRSHFYDRNLKVISLGKVYDVISTLDNTRYYNQIEYGYAGKIDMSGAQVNAIDEFNTLRRSLLPIVNTKNQIVASSKVHTSGFEIEYERRLAGKTTDSQLDPELFAAVLIRDTVEAEKDFDASGSFTEDGSGLTITLDMGGVILSGNHRIVVGASLTNGVGEVMVFQLFEDPGGSHVIVNPSGASPLNVFFDGVVAFPSPTGSLTLVMTSSIGVHFDYSYSIRVIYDVDAGTFRTKKDEGYASILNVLDAPTGYNYDISPARNLKNWLPFLATNTHFSSSKIVTFSYGEINYEMKSKKMGEADYLSEKGDVDLTGVVALYDNSIYRFSSPLTRDQVRAIKESPYGYIEFEDLFGAVMGGFISPKGLAYDQNKETAVFELLKLF